MITRRVVAILMSLCCFPITHASELYTISIVAETGTSTSFVDGTTGSTEVLSFTNLLNGVSVNESGTTAWVANTADGGAVYSRDRIGPAPVTSPVIRRSSFAPSISRLYRSFVQINDEGVIAAGDRASNTEFLRLLGQAAGFNTSTVIVSGNSTTPITQDPFEIVFTPGALANSGQLFFYAQTGRRGSLPITCPLNCVAVRNPNYPATSPEYFTKPTPASLLRPAVSNNAVAVYKNGTSAGDPIVRISLNPSVPGPLPDPVTVSTGFQSTGRSPGITDQGSAIVFTGDRGNGSGVFAWFPDLPQLGIVRIAGEGVADLGQLDQRVVGPATPLRFVSFDMDARAAIVHRQAGRPGLLDDIFLTSFIATPERANTPDLDRHEFVPGHTFSAARGLWVVRIDVVDDSAGAISLQPRLPMPVLQQGDPIPGVAGTTVAQIGIHDPLALAAGDGSDLSKGNHQLSFWVSANEGTRQYILHASQRDTCLLPVTRFGQGDSRWANQSYDSSGVCDIVDKGCALTSLGMGLRYASNKYSLPLAVEDSGGNDVVLDPGSLDDYLVDQGAYSGSAVDGASCDDPETSSQSVNWWLSTNMVNYSSGLGQTQARYKFQARVLLDSTAGLNGDPSDDYVIERICTAGLPVVLGVHLNAANNPRHFVLGAGVSNGRVVVADPGAFAAPQFLSERYVTRGVVDDPPNDNVMSITTNSDVQLSVIDSAGRVTGFDGGARDEIPSSVAFRDAYDNPATGAAPTNDSQLIYVYEPTQGAYQIQIVGNTNTTFSVKVSRGQEGTPALQLELSGSISAGQIQSIPFTLTAGGGLSSGQESIAVPDVLGLAQSAAIAAIENAGLVLGTVTQQPSTSAIAGHVISQSPVGNTSVSAGSAVHLVVSSGPVLINVPSVVGLAQSAAMAALTDAGLLLGTVTQQSSASVPAGSVVSQNPASGSSVTAGSAVHLVISSGPTMVSVPNLVGLAQAEVINVINSAGLALGSVTHQSSALVPDGRVISQSPSGGTSVAAGSVVHLVVSSGPALVEVPNVVGLAQAMAISAITSAGLAVGALTQQSSSSVPAGNVISQNPTSGGTVAAGMAVSLVVSSGPAAALACDVNLDGRIDRTDIALITAARNQPASGPFDPRDPDRNGIINVLDARQCTASCSSASCATP